MLYDFKIIYNLKATKTYQTIHNLNLRLGKRKYKSFIRLKMIRQCNTLI